MRLRRQSGITLVETAVAVAIATVVVAGAFFAIATVAKHMAQQGGPARMRAMVIAQQTLRVAQNAWKYGSPGTAPAGTQSISSGTVTTTITGSTSPAQITVTVQYTPEPGRSGDSGVVSVSGAVDEKAPLPGSQVDRPGLIPLPSSAP
ncbi:MAG TPA: prepilin-type N-terminal cleavage/methylation domain-containing protein [Candidatus Baltobacteraceae bacterium]|nr:prepilin-type N-terminal cleavage/methylation domain-containing protein [Candidatus Baltobacteraceae bacterium]